MSVNSRRQTPTWPFLLVLVSLFVLSLTAPRKWEMIARSKPLINSAKYARRTTPSERPRKSVDQPEAIAEISVAETGADVGAKTPRVRQSPAALPPVVSEPARTAATATIPSVRQEPTPSGPQLSEPRLAESTAAPANAGPTIAFRSTQPPLLGPNGQLSLRVPADLSPPLVTFRPQRPSAPPVLESPASPLAPTVVDAPVRSTDVDGAAAGEEASLIEPSLAEQVLEEDTFAGPVTPAFRWADPAELMLRLESLAGRDHANIWAYEVMGLVHELLGTGGPHTAEAREVLSRLQEVAAESSSVAAKLADRDSADLQRAAFALRRRLAVWRPLAELPRPDDAELALTVPEPERLSLCLSEITALTQQDAAGAGWRDYLMFDSLEQLAAGRGGSSAPAARLLAQRVLARLTAARLSKSQRKFVTDETLTHLAGELRTWAAAPIDAEALLAHVEEYERDGSTSVARLLAAELQHLAWSPALEIQDYGRELEQNYRNANVRLVISETLLSRMMPPQDPVDEVVRVTILGNATRGRSHTETTTSAELIPDPRRLRFRVIARGNVTARTHTQSGPATVYSNSASTFQAIRDMEITLSGMRAGEMQVSAQSSARLRDVDTSFDGIPLVGSLVDNYARDQYSLKRRTAERELERIVAQKAINNISTQSSARVAETNRRLQEHVLNPLDKLQIEPTLIETQTSDDRMTIRMRLAGEGHLGAHTPRPRAPSDSLLSAQLHETAINNFLDRLNLGGRLMSQRAIYESMAETFNLPPAMLPADLRDNLLVQLSETDPIRVRFQDNRIAIEIKMDELRHEGQSYRNFAVRVHYCLDPESNGTLLMRDGPVQLIGQGLRAKAQIALRGMFSKTFNKERRLPIMPEKFAADPRLAGLGITQWVVVDGWVGLALGPARTAASPVASAR